MPDELKHSPSSPELSPAEDRKTAVLAPPTLPTFESTHKDHSWAKSRTKFTKALKKGSKIGKKNDHDIFDTSSESSDSSDSTEQGKEERGRHRHSKQRDKFDMPDGDPFAPPVRSADRDKTQKPHTSHASHTSRDSSVRDSIDHANLPKHLRPRSTSVGVNKEAAKPRNSSKRRTFLSSLKLESEDKVRSSLEYDSTAPSTPVGYNFPSIAINLSPPDSRTASPTRKDRGSIFSTVKDKIQSQKDHIDRIDFAQQDSSNQSSKRGSTARELDVSHHSSRGPSPMSRGTSPFSKQLNRIAVDDGANSPIEPRGSTISKVSTQTAESKTTDSSTHRFHRVRGMFKGGRIAQLIGNEVEKVSEYIWKRDPPRSAEMDGGSISGYESDSEEVTGHHNDLLKPPNHQLRVARDHKQAADETSPPSHDTRESNDEAPQYHIQGLPNFTSPFQRDRDSIGRTKGEQSPGGTSQKTQAEEYDSDPVSTAARARRAAGKSPRLGQLAPPKLDIRSATPDGRRRSYGFGAALDLTRARSASQLFNGAVNGQHSNQDTDKRHGSAAFRRSSKDLSRSFSRERHSPSRPRNITIRDFFRTRALLLATAIKSTNISAYCDEIPQPQSSFLYSAFKTTGVSGSEINKHLPARRREEHVIAARHVIGHLNKQSGEFNEALSTFTKSTTVELHREIQILEDNAASSLFPRLQKLSDQAGQLAQKLTTTSTLAVRGVNDDVSEAMRMKRRGPYRLGKQLGYKLIEWGVVGVLWLIWFVVMVVRFLLGSMKALRAVVAWLLWLR